MTTIKAAPRVTSELADVGHAARNTFRILLSKGWTKEEADEIVADALYRTAERLIDLRHETEDRHEEKETA